jgi:hypothetical protein
MNRLRVYCAGAYSGPDVLSVLGNMRRGIRLATDVLQAGFAPFCPWYDYHYCLATELRIEDLYSYSMAWLEASQAVIVCPIGAATSRGTQAEITRANELGIPVFWSLADLQTWAAKQNHFTVSALPPRDKPAEMHGGILATRRHTEVELDALVETVKRCHCVRTKEEECCGK